MAPFVRWLMKIAVYNYSESLEETKHCHVYIHMHAYVCMRTCQTYSGWQFLYWT